MSAELKFWLFFFLLNSLFFIPRYILEVKHSNFIPYKGLLEGPLKERIRFLINRYNYDIFRVSFDFLFLSLSYFFLKAFIPSSIFGWLLFLSFSLLLIYQLYYHIFESIYQLEPTFHSDSLMLKTGFQLFFKGFNGVNALITLGIIGLFVLIFFGVKTLLAAATIMEWSILSYSLFLVFGLLGIYSLFTYNYKAFGKIAFPSQTQSLLRNIRQSLATKRNLAKYDFESLAMARPYQNFELIKKPNIFFLAIESYGRIVYDDPELYAEYSQYMLKLEQALGDKGWKSSSNLSTSPVSGGSSWISFTSMLFGLSIKDQGSYLTMLHKPIMHKYANFMRQMKEMAYKTYRLISIAGFKGMKIPWEDYTSFYAIDEWITFEDLQYEGKLYGFGPCPPDQYALHFANQQIRKNQQPFFLFFITQNSHSPFGSPETIVPDWKSLNTPFKEPQFSSSIFVRPKLDDYKKAIRYQLHFLIDFITKEGTDNDLFILIGDHQPPVFPKPDAEWETPVHIISKNKAFIEQLTQYGFAEGLLANTSKNYIRHEGLYSLLMRELIRAYGPDQSVLPDYKSEGAN